MSSRLNASTANSDSVRKRIEKHSFEDEDGEEYSGSKFGGFPEYFRRKKIKLQNLDVEMRASGADNPKIFRGVVAHVNGYTQPSLNDIHRMIVSHGGGFMQYLDGKTTVTHIIASSLTPKKCVEFRRYRIVKPAWVVDSVKAGKLLPWNDYRVVNEVKGQNLLNINSGKVTSQANQATQGYRDQTESSWYTSQLRQNGKEEARDSKAVNEQSSHVTAEPVKKPSALRSLLQAISNDEAAAPELLEKRIEELKNRQAKDDVREKEDEVEGAEDKPKKQKDKTSDDRQPPNVEPKDPEEELTAEQHNAQLLSDPRMWKSSVLNPDFLKQYYSESRLHHLSAWKAELKSRVQKLALEKSLSQKIRQKRPPEARRYILHVDFDSFFAAVSLRKRPELATEPVVVAHGSGPGSEIASCNYAARKFGVSNGMWMKKALELCADLKVLPYDFEAYEDASQKFYAAILSIDGIVQSVSVDEALVDISVECWNAGHAVPSDRISREQERADAIALNLRDSIRESTGCEVSVGIGGNILLAKVALRKAKPAGQYQLKSEDVLEFLGPLSVQSLPGIAYNLGGKLEELGVKLVSDLRNLSKERLITSLGPKTGQKLWEYSRGIDLVEVGEQVIRKSVSAEVNWGVRFETQAQVEEFIQSLGTELSRRLLKEGVNGKQITMKIMRRAADAPRDPPKNLGHGKCDTFNRSVQLGVASNMSELISKEAIAILRQFGFSPGELRGLGIQMTKLEPMKPVTENINGSSQKRLQFKSATPTKAKDALAVDPILDDVESPAKAKAVPQPLLPVTAKRTSHRHEELNTINTSGTQFILPTQVDPQILSELPQDIRSKLRGASSRTRPAAKLPSASSSRSQSPTPAAPFGLPSQSQLDPETLAALPADVREEILGFYNQGGTGQRPARAAHSPSPAPTKTINPPAKKPATITKTGKRRGRPPKGSKPKTMGNPSGLAQSNFVMTRAASKNNSNSNNNTEAVPNDIAPEFLAALPPDIRAEVLASHRRSVLQRSSLALPKVPKALRNLSKAQNAPPRPLHVRRRVPRRPRPTFTSRKLSSLPDLRDAVTAWVQEFSDEGPYGEDVDALGEYLRRVVGEEKDMAKAVSVVKWLCWYVDASTDDTEEQRQKWDEAIESVRTSVQDAVAERGLGKINFG